MTPTRFDIRITPDAANLKFSGHETVALTVKARTDRIQLNAADIAFQKVTLFDLPSPTAAGSDASLPIHARTPETSLDKGQQTATFIFDHPLAPGRYTLALDYTGVIYEQASGLFALDYTGEAGTKQRALFTQFENSDARRFIPS